MYSLEKSSPPSNTYSIKQNQHGPATFQPKTRPYPHPPTPTRPPDGPSKM